MASGGVGFFVSGGVQVVAGVIVPGEIQVTGDGTPFVLIAESQTTGGYPRIATVIPPDLGRVAQAGAGAKIRFSFIDIATAVDLHRRDQAELRGLSKAVTPLVRNPADIANLREFQLISGATSGADQDEEHDL